MQGALGKPVVESVEFYRIAEFLGLEGSGDHLVQPPAKAGPPRAGYTFSSLRQNRSQIEKSPRHILTHPTRSQYDGMLTEHLHSHAVSLSKRGTAAQLITGGSSLSVPGPSSSPARGPAGAAAAMEPALGPEFEDSLFAPSRERRERGGDGAPSGARHCEPGVRGLGRREGTGAGRAVTALCVRFGRRVCPQGFHGP